MDITDRLSRMAPDHTGPVSDEIVAQDLARSRRALSQRRLRRGLGAGVAALAVAGATVLVVHHPGGSAPTRAAHDPSTRPPVASTPAGPPASASTGPDPSGTAISPLAVKLVSYSGPQKNGFIVSKIPAGWTLADSEPGFLTISPPGDTTNDGASFVDKLTVMLRSADDTGPLQGVPVTVGGRPGAVVTDTGVKTLTWNDGKHWVQIQAWSNLHWNDQQLVDFASCVTVTANVVVPNG